MLNCVLCGEPSSEPLSFRGSDGRSKLSVVRFVVRIFLELDVSGDRRAIDELCDSWSTCLECTEATQESFEIYRQLVKLTEKFRKNRNQIAEKCKRFVNCTNYGGNQVTKTIHDAVSKGLWPPDDFSAPFLLVDPQTFLKEIVVKHVGHHEQNTRTVGAKPQVLAERDSKLPTCNGEELVKEEVETGEENTTIHFALDANGTECFPTSKGENKKDENGASALPNNDSNPKGPVTATRKRQSKRPTKTPLKPRRKKNVKKAKVPLYTDLEQDPVTKMYKCQSCDYSNPEGRLVRAHFSRFHVDKSQRPQYSCDWPNCGRVFFSKGNLIYHKDEHNKTPRFHCSQCPKSFYRTNALTQHRQLDHEGGRHDMTKFTCDKCGKGFGSRGSLHGHVYHQHSKTKASKPRRTTGSNAWRHTTKIQKYSSEEKQICQTCGQSVRILGFKLHMWNIHRDESFSDGILKCWECQHGFPHQQGLDIHMYSKHKIGAPPATKEPEPWRCDVQGCRKRFYGEEKYKKHMEEIHGPDKKKPGRFECKFCGKRFFIQYKHEQHEMSHENLESKPFVCDTCGKGFPTNAYLRYHLVHTHKMKMENRQGYRHLKGKLTTSLE